MKIMQLTQTIPQAQNTSGNRHLTRQDMKALLLAEAKKENPKARRKHIETVEYDETVPGSGEDRPFTVHVILMRIELP